MASPVLTYLNPADAARGATGLVTEDGDVLLVTPGSGGGAGSETLVFPNIAAMAAFPAGTLTAGQEAITEKNGARWSLQPSTEGSDGITVVTATGSALKWLRQNVNVLLPTWIAQRTWVVDRVGGNDENSGLTTLQALKTVAEIYRRWAYTWSPNLVGVANFSVQYVSNATDGTDPSSFAPILEDGATFTEFAALPAAGFTGTLLAVTPKNRGANQALEATFTTTTGALAQGMTLVNTTRGNSRSMNVANLGAGLWLLAQPLTPYAGGFPGATEVDTWANGDSIQGFVPIKADISRIGARNTTLDGSFDPAHLVQNVTIVDGNATAGQLLADSNLAAIEDCSSSRQMQVPAYATVISENCTFLGVQAASAGGLNFVGGQVGAPGLGTNIQTNRQGATLFALDTILRGTVSVDGAALGSCYVHTGDTFIVVNSANFTNVIYGPGTLNVAAGSLVTGGSAVSTLPIATKQLNGVATGYSRTNAAPPVVIHGGIALTSANLDAAAGAAGFGGFAEGGGAFISINGVQP